MPRLSLDPLEDRATPAVAFAAPLVFTPGNNPQGFAIADLNADGRPDLVTANANADTVSVLLNDTPAGGVPAFLGQVAFPVGSNPRSVTAGDFNADGRPDLAVGNRSGSSVSVLLNTTPAGAATPTFAAHVTFAVGTGPSAVVVADLNADGLPDLATANDTSDNVSVRLNTTTSGAATPTFAAPVAFAAGDEPRSIAAADFNADGRPDLVTANNSADTIAVLLNTTADGAAAPTFAAAVPTAAGDEPRSLTVGDFNGDARPDVVVTNNTAGTAFVYLNATPVGAVAPAFAAPLTLTVGNNPQSVAVADLTSDGRPDVVVANLNGGALSVFENATPAGSATATFLAAHPVATASSPQTLAVADLNADGRPDIGVTIRTPDSVTVFPNTTELPSPPPPPPPPLPPLLGPVRPVTTVSPFGTTNTPTRTATGDVNGDGVADLVAVTGPGTALRAAVLSGADGSVLVAPFDPFGGDFAGGGYVAAGDLDGDGNAEFVVTPDEGGGPRVSIYTLNLNGTTAVRANFFGIDDPNFRGGARAAVGDVNGDGIPDVIVAAGFGGGPRTAIFTGQSVLAGAPTRLVGDFFAFPGADAQTLRNGSFVAAGDVTGDGFADLVFGGGPGGAPRVFILSGALVSAGQVGAAQASPVANFFVAGDLADRGGARVAVTNSDGDTRADVAVGSGAGRPAKVRVYLGKDFGGGDEPPATDLDVLGGAVLADGVYVG